MNGITFGTLVITANTPAMVVDFAPDSMLVLRRMTRKNHPIGGKWIAERKDVRVVTALELDMFRYGNGLPGRWER